MESGFYALRLHRSNRFMELTLRDRSLFARKLESGDEAQACVWYVDFLPDSKVTFRSARGKYLSTKYKLFSYSFFESDRDEAQGPGNMEKFTLVSVFQDKTMCYFLRSSLGKYISVKMPELVVQASASSTSADAVFEFVKLESADSPIVFV